jgi:hypothetical protein
MRAIIFVLLILTGVFWWWGVSRAATLFTVKVRQGRISRTQGRIPPRLHAEIVEIIERANVTHANIRGVIRDGRPVLLFEGEMSSGTQQQMRNVVGQFSTSEIRSGRRH